MKNLVLCKGRSSWFACTMKTMISAVAKESRLDIFNEYESFNFNFVLLFLKKTLAITTNMTNYLARSSRPEVFCIIGVLRDLTKFTGKHLCQSLFFIKAAGLTPRTLLKKRRWHSCFPVKFVKFLRTPFYTEHLWWLLLSEHE